MRLEEGVLVPQVLHPRAVLEVVLDLVLDRLLELRIRIECPIGLRELHERPVVDVDDRAEGLGARRVGEGRGLALSQREDVGDVRVRLGVLVDLHRLDPLHELGGDPGGDLAGAVGEGVEVHHGSGAYPGAACGTPAGRDPPALEALCAHHHVHHLRSLPARRRRRARPRRRGSPRPGPRRRPDVLPPTPPADGDPDAPNAPSRLRPPSRGSGTSRTSGSSPSAGRTRRRTGPSTRSG